MKLYQIEYIMATVESGSMSKASENMHVSRSSISRAIKDAEEEFGVKLFVRTTQGIVLSHAGEQFYKIALGYNRISLQLMNEMEKYREKASYNNHLCVRMTYTAQCKYLPLVNSFIRQHPEAQIEIVDYFPPESDNSEDNKADISFVLGLKPVDAFKKYIMLDQTEFVFICSKNHHLASRKSVTIYDIKNEPLVGLNRFISRGNYIVSLFTQNNLTPFFKYWTSQMSTCYNMVAEGLCCTIKPIDTIYDNHNIIAIPFSPPEVFHFRCQWDTKKNKSSLFYDFIDYISLHYGGIQY